jgi:regulator of sigma E protease
MIVNILALIVVLGVLIFIHEGGHFLAARWVGAPVTVFSFGFGRRLFGFKRGETDYRISLIPLGGYVRIHGLGPDESDVVGAAAAETPLLPRWQRALISIAGPAANAVSAVVFVAVAFMVGVQVPAWQDAAPEIAWVDASSPAANAGLRQGDLVLSIDGKAIRTWRELEMATLGAANRTLAIRYRRGGADGEVMLTPESRTSYDLGYAGMAPPLPAEISGTQAGSPAERAGLRPGDRILAVNGEPVRHFYDVMRLVGRSPNRELVLTIGRGAETLTVAATPRDVDGQGKLGIPAPNPTALKRLGVLAAVGEGARECIRMTRETFAVLGRMVSGRASMKQMSGPIDIARFSGEAARTGVVAMVWLLGIISLQLAIFNVLPIPLLDGGHLALLAIEAVRRKDLSWKVKERILNVGFYLIIGLVIIVLYNDIAKILPAGLEKLIPWRK